jgi:hypothetical protein
MKIFKFTSGSTGPIEVYYFNETLRLQETFDYKIWYKDYFTENLRLRGILGAIYNYLLEEYLNLKERIGWAEYLIEVLGLTDLEERIGWGYFSELMSLQDTCSPRMVYSISLNENIGLAESGTVNLAKVDYKITWRARTKEPGIGYGKAGYGISYNYGEGDCIDLKSFKVRVYVMPAHTLKRTATITIADTQNPDNNAEYVYTSAFNIADNTTFKANLQFEVVQIDQSDVESPVASIDIEPIPL